MAGVCPVSLSVAVAKAGGMGSCGALLMNKGQIADWVNDMRSNSNGMFQLNTWIPDPEPVRDLNNESIIQDFLSKWGPEVPDLLEDLPKQEFAGQCEAMLKANPTVISSIMGLYPPEFVSQMKDRNIKWFATITTVNEAIQAQKAGAYDHLKQRFQRYGQKQ